MRPRTRLWRTRLWTNRPRRESTARHAASTFSRAEIICRTGPLRSVFAAAPPPFRTEHHAPVAALRSSTQCSPFAARGESDSRAESPAAESPSASLDLRVLNRSQTSADRSGPLRAASPGHSARGCRSRCPRRSSAHPPRAHRIRSLERSHSISRRESISRCIETEACALVHRHQTHSSHIMITIHDRVLHARGAFDSTSTRVDRGRLQYSIAQKFLSHSVEKMKS